MKNEVWSFWAHKTGRAERPREMLVSQGQGAFLLFPFPEKRQKSKMLLRHRLATRNVPAVHLGEDGIQKPMKLHV